MVKVMHPHQKFESLKFGHVFEKNVPQMRSSDEFGLTLKYQFPVNKNQLNRPKCHLKTNGCQIITDSTVRLSYMVLAPVENQERISDADSFQITPFYKKACAK
jgi:hypothetical protein